MFRYILFKSKLVFDQFRMGKKINSLNSNKNIIRINQPIMFRLSISNFERKCKCVSVSFFYILNVFGEINFCGFSLIYILKLNNDLFAV